MRKKIFGLAVLILLLCTVVSLVSCNKSGSTTPTTQESQQESEPAGTTTPVETPEQTDPVDTDPVDTDPVDTDPVDTDPVDTDPNPDQPDDPDQPTHQHSYSASVTAPDCTNAGYTTYTCECGDSYVADEVAALGHAWQDATCTTAKTCSVCGTIEGEALGHAYNAAVTAPDCTNGGYTTYTCSVCGDSYVANETNALGHSYNAAVTAPDCENGGYTTYTCACGDSYVADEVAALGHTWQDATCTTPKTCSVCGTTEGAVLGHTWKDADCTTAKTCSVCGETDGAALGHSYSAAVTAPTCTAGGYTTYTCAACGDSYVADQVAALGHSYSAVVTAPDCTNGGYTTYTCATCGDSYVADPTDALGHAWVEANCTDPKTCSVCGATEGAELGHAYNAVVTAPDCENGGYTTYTCACGDSYVADETDALGHTPGAAATCTAAQICTVCQATLNAKLNHTYENGFCTGCGISDGHTCVWDAVVTAPTCTEAGFTTYTCTICFEIEIRDEVAALGHDYDAVVTAPDCVNDGYTTYTCSVCGDSYVADEVDALGHSYSAVVTAPTCTAGGYTTYTCSVCGNSYVADQVAAYGHSYSASVTAPNCENGGYTTYTCATCGDSYVANHVDALGHSYNAVVTAPDCENGGYTTYTCSACGYYYVANQVAALGHSYNAVVTAPTCTNDGYTTYTCSACGDSYVADEVASLGHTWVDANCTTPKTCSKCGATEGSTSNKHAIEDSYICSVCGKNCILTIDEVINIGMSYEKGAYSSEYYWVKLTLDHQANPTGGFARATISSDFYITVQAFLGTAAPTYKLGDTVIFKAKIGAANSVMTAGGKEPRLYETAYYEVIATHTHAYGQTVTTVVPATCGKDGKGTVACTCGATQEVVIPATGLHTEGDSYLCTVCGKSFILSIEEVINIGMSYEKGAYSSEYYWVQLTLDHQANPTGGFARATISSDFYITVHAFLGTAAPTYKLGDTVIFKAKIGAANSVMTTGGKEPRLYETAYYEVVPVHTHVYNQTIEVIVPSNCSQEGKEIVACACGDTKEVTIPKNDAHVPNDDFVCGLCGKSLLISVEEAIEIGMSYEKGKYSSEYYYVQLTLDDQVNDNGFARAFISDGLYISVAGPYAMDYVNGTIKLGNVVIFKAKLGAVNSSVTTGGKELRLYEVADYKIVSTQGVNVSVTIDGKSDILNYHATYAGFTQVDKAPAGVTFDYGYFYQKKSGAAAIERSALVWNTYGKYSTISFDIYVDKITNASGSTFTEVEMQLSQGAYFVSVVDASGKEVSAIYKDNHYVVLQRGQSYHIVINVNDTIQPEFYFGLNSKVCEVYFYNISIQASGYEYVVDSAEQTIVCKKDGETYGYFAWPTVTKLDGKRLIAVASGMRSAHTGMDGKLVCWYSEDEGKTWSEPQLLMDTVLDDRDAGVVYWNGKIIVSWFCASQAYYNTTVIDEALDTQLMGGNYIISEDGGKTWSKIYYMPDGMFTPHGLIINPEGGLTSVGYLKYDKATRRWGTGIAVRTTTGEMNENGFIWSDPIIIADSDTQYSWDFQEPYGIYNDDGVLIVVMRSDKGLYQCELYPGETKFTAWHLIAFVQETPAHMIQHSSGVMIMTYGYRGIYVDPITGKTVSYTERNKDKTLGIRARFSYDGGLTWTQEVILSYGLMPASNSSDWGYTSSIELSDGKILTLFYQRTGNETKASIYQIVWEVPAAPSGEVTITFVGGSTGGDTKITNVTGNAGEDIILPATPTLPGYKFAGWYLDHEYKIPFTATTFSKDMVVYAKWTADTAKSLSVMSFNVKTGNSSSNGTLVINTILENAPYVFGVQEADYSWMNKLKSSLTGYTCVGQGRDGGTSIISGEYSAIFFRTDMFTKIADGTLWLSATPNSVSKYSYTDANGTKHTANYNRIMTYVVLERKSDGVRFIYVNTHLDNNGSNDGIVAENIRKGQVEILMAQIQNLYKTYGNLPTVVTGDFNTQGVVNNTISYNAMINGGYLDSSRIAKEGEVKGTFTDMNNENSGVIFDYVFVSSDLANAVETYTVCPAKRDGKFISDHNAIIATIIIA